MKSFLQSNLLVLFIANSANFFAYLFQFMLSRYMSIENFGIFNALNSLLMIVISINGVISFTVAKELIEKKLDKEYAKRIFLTFFEYVSYLSILLLVFMLIFKQDLILWFKLVDATALYIMWITVYIAMLMAILLGFLQGHLMHFENALKGFLYAFLRVVFGFLFIAYLGYSYNAALLSSLLSHLVVIFLIYHILKYKLNLKLSIKQKAVDNKKELLVQSFPIMLTWMAIAFLSNIDVLLINTFLPTTQVGLYSSASIVGKIAFFLPAAITFVIYPELLAKEKGRLKMLLQALTLTLLLSGGFTVVVYFFPLEIVTLLFGEKYIEAAPMIVMIAVFMSAVSVLNVLVYYLLAQKSYFYLYVMYCAFIVLMVYLHIDPPLTYEDVLEKLLFLVFSIIGIYTTIILRNNHQVSYE